MKPEIKKIIGILIDVVAWVFIFLWIYAATSKLLDYQGFVSQIGQSPILNPVKSFVAWFVPLVELMIAFLLLIPAYREAGLYASFGLMVMFTAYIIAITQFSDKVPCSCGGILQKMGWSEHLVFNCALIIIAAIAIIAADKNILLQQIRENRKPG